VKKGATRFVSLNSILMAVLLPSCKKGVPESSIDLGTARTAYEKSDYATALSGLGPLANTGNAEAQFMLGKIFEKGGIYERGGQLHASNYREALRWYRLAVERNNGDAEDALGDLYSEGHGVPQDKSEAVKWYRLGSAHGNASASFSLGDRYYRGDGVSKNVQEATKFWLLAAKQAPKPRNVTASLRIKVLLMLSTSSASCMSTVAVCRRTTLRRHGFTV
jgi:TPR repeat protein